MTGVTTEKAPCRFDSTLKMNNPYWSTQFRRMHLPLDSGTLITKECVDRALESPTVKCAYLVMHNCCIWRSGLYVRYVHIGRLADW
jgi:hypothetical protein